MAYTDIDAVRKQKKTEYDKQYRLKSKLLLQQQASKDIYMIRYFHPYPLRTVRPIYRTGVLLPSKCCILYIFFSNKYKYRVF
jgi:hypothetical protein